MNGGFCTSRGTTNRELTGEERGRFAAEVIVGIDPDPTNFDLVRDWARNYYDATHPFATDGSAYVNYMIDDGDERIEGTYCGNYESLQEIKTKYDPENFFKVNQNIPLKD